MVLLKSFDDGLSTFVRLQLMIILILNYSANYFFDSSINHLVVSRREQVFEHC